MSLDVQGILERAGADPNAPEGSQAWALAQVAKAHAELASAIEAYREADQEYGACGYGSFEHEQRLLRSKLDAAERVDAVLVQIGAA